MALPRTVSRAPALQDAPQRVPQSRHQPLSLHTSSIDWTLLENGARALAKPRGRPKTLLEAEQFNSAYRRGATELARLKAFSPNRVLSEFAENAIAMSHLATYRRDPVTLGVVMRGVAFGLPMNVRKQWPYHVVSLGILLVFTFIAFFSVLADPSTYYMFVDRGLASGRDPWASREFLAKSLEGHGSLDENIAFSLMLFQHNTRVAFICYSTGVLLGLPTILMLAMTGLMLGGMIAVFYRVGLTAEFMAWILPHGVPEIGAIILCGGAGLALGHRLLNPGNRPRGEVLSETAMQSSVIAVSCAVLLFIAGFIEGVFRQSNASLFVRYGLFAFLLAGMLAWLLFVRERRQRETQAT